MASGAQLVIVKAQEEKSDRDWTSLPADILHLVVHRQFYYIPDYVRMGFVCSSWRATVPAELRSFPKLLLLASTPGSHQEGSSRSLFTADRKPFLHGGLPINLPPPFEKRWCGSSFGWLAVATDYEIDKKQQHKVALGVSLLNPFTGATIRLPPIIMRRRKDAHFRPHHEYWCYKVVLSADPVTDPDTFEAVAMYGAWCRLAHYKSGAKCWTYVPANARIQPTAGSKFKKVWHCFDALHYRGKFYGLFNDGLIFSIEPGDNLTLKTIVPPPNFEGYRGSYRQYIVESSTGDLLVARKWDRRWKIFKAIDSCSGGTCDHEEVKSLGDDSLFVGSNRSVALPVSAAGRAFLPGCRKNCVYFTDDEYENLTCDLEMTCYSLDQDVSQDWHYDEDGPSYTRHENLSDRVPVPAEMTCYDLAQVDWNPEEDVPSHTHHPWPPPIWIEPNFTPFRNSVP